jgi:hypothetical protein
MERFGDGKRLGISDGAGYDGGFHLHIAWAHSESALFNLEFSVRNIIRMPRQSVRLKEILKVLLYSNIFRGFETLH